MIESIIYANPLNLMKRTRDVVICTDTALSGTAKLGRYTLGGKDLFQNGGRSLEPGNVVTYRLDEKRELHLLVCHATDGDGWLYSQRHVRLALHYIWQRRSPTPRYAVVEIGDGPHIARTLLILEMVMSPLRLRLYIWGRQERDRARDEEALPPLRPVRVWRINDGEREIRMK